MTVPPPVTNASCGRWRASAAKSASPLRAASDRPLGGADATPGESGDPEGESDRDADGGDADGGDDGDFARYAKPTATIRNRAQPSNARGGRRLISADGRFIATV